MGYIDKNYYYYNFHGEQIPDDDFDRIADIASDVIYGVCCVKPKASDLTKDTFKKAIAYQVELLHKQGGINAIVGFSEASFSGSESLGDYTVSVGNARQEAVWTYNGIPISSMSIMLLNNIGLMSRWAYAGRKNNDCT